MRGDVVPDFRFVHVLGVVPDHQGSQKPPTLRMDDNFLQYLPVPLSENHSRVFLLHVTGKQGTNNHGHIRDTIIKTINAPAVFMTLDIMHFYGPISITWGIFRGGPRI